MHNWIPSRKCMPQFVVRSKQVIADKQSHRKVVRGVEKIRITNLIRHDGNPCRQFKLASVDSMNLGGFQLVLRSQESKSTAPSNRSKQTSMGTGELTAYMGGVGGTVPTNKGPSPKKSASKKDEIYNKVRVIQKMISCLKST